jgi:hypothetical protein
MIFLQRHKARNGKLLYLLSRLKLIQLKKTYQFTIPGFTNPGYYLCHPSTRHSPLTIHHSPHYRRQILTLK